MYLDTKRFKSQERSAVLLLLLIYHEDGNTAFSLFPTSDKTWTIKLSFKKKRLHIFRLLHCPYYKTSAPPYQTTGVCTYTSYVVTYIANRGLCM